MRITTRAIIQELRATQALLHDFHECRRQQAEARLALGLAGTAGLLARLARARSVSQVKQAIREDENV